MSVFKISQTSNLKRFYVLALIVILSFSCEKDDSHNQDINIVQTEEKGYSVKKVTLKEVKQSSLIKNALSNIERQLDYNKVNTIDLSKSKKPNSTNTSAIASNDPIKSKDNTFTILTDEILQVSTDSTEVYTFRLETPTEPESDFENFVIHKNSDDSVLYYIYRYKNFDSDSSVLNFSREEVNSDQINIGDFDDYIQNVKLYDPVSGCSIIVMQEGGVLVIEIGECFGTGSGGDSNSDSSTGGGGGGTTRNIGDVWYTYNGDGTCNRHERHAGTTVPGNGGYYDSLEPNIPCQGTSNSGSGSQSNTGSTNPWDDSNYSGSNGDDPLYEGSSGGSGSSSSNGSNGTNMDNGNVVVAILPLTPLEAATNNFFDNLTDEQKDCLTPVFGQPQNTLKEDITQFFEDNQTIRKPGYDGGVIDLSLINFANEIINSGINKTLVTAFPFVKYPPNSNYSIQYPKLTEYLKNQLPKVADIPLIVNTIKYLTGLSESKIKEDLKWGKGPTIHITQLDDFSQHTSDKTVGRFEEEEPDVLHLDIDFVNKLENSTASQDEQDAFLFFIGTTVLHEYVHYGDFQDGVQYSGEEGILFELYVYGENVGSENAGLILNKK